MSWTSVPLLPILERLERLEKQLTRIADALEKKAR